jgi:(p)ppGpp synthase/HD superfamily hydrolase
VNLQKYEKMRRVVERYHKGQYRNKDKNSPYRLHCEAVALLVKEVLTQTGEYDDNADDIVLAALGHDLYEDTSVDRDFIRQEFGAHVDELIFQLTNEEDDEHRDKYMQKIHSASDEVILIKLADMIENMNSVFYNRSVLGQEWVDTFFLPIMDDYLPHLHGKKFTNYVQTGNYLLAYMKASYGILAQVK